MRVEGEARNLVLLIEECAEVQQAATKVLRFGVGGHYQTGEHQGRTNVEALEVELGHLLAIYRSLRLRRQVHAGRVMDSMEKHADKLAKVEGL